MKEKQLRDDIIVKMLDYRDRRNIDINEFCSTNNINFSSNIMRDRIFRTLNDDGYIKAFVDSGGGSFNITSTGIDYAENLLTQNFKKTTKLVNENKVEINDDLVPHIPLTGLIQEVTPPIYTTKESNRIIVDNSVEACFNVEKLAECYVKLIDRACETGLRNVCMFGIFAPWGRGKTYFFKKIKEYINERKSPKAIQYDIVEFNAWKYQETPALWAYLFETFYNSKSSWFKFCYTLIRSWKAILSDLTKYTIPIIITIFISSMNIVNDQNMNKLYVTSGCLSVSLFICNLLLKHYNSALSFMKKYSKGISFANELGIQAEIEKEITFLLKFWIDKKNFILKFFIHKRIKFILKPVIYLRRMYISKILSGKKNRCCYKKVILYIDDIDRCSETKMTSIIDSLRTVLENEEIRKRLIIICSIDPEKIIKGIEYKYKTLYENDDKKIHSIAIEQMDKIFLTGIALAPLNYRQLYEFASKLTEVDDQNFIYEQMFKYIDNQRKANSTTPKNNINTENEEQIELSNAQIYKHLKNIIRKNGKQLTPRKIRIIYYRILLANNIICNKEDSMITETLIKNISNLSVGNKIENSDKSEELSDVLNMVVPYRYNEENEVEEDKEDEVAS